MRASRAGQLSMWKGVATAYAVRNAAFGALLAQAGMTGNPVQLSAGRRNSPGRIIEISTQGTRHVRLLLVEDDAMIGASVQQGLRQDGFSVDWVRDGRAAELALGNETYDLVVLDLGLPRKSGLDVLRDLRRKGNSTPVLVLTARDTVPDRVTGLDAGADDYLVKPFDLNELAARLRALLRRRAGRADPLIRHGNLTLNPATREAAFNGKPLVLSVREFAVIRTLLDRPGALLSRVQIEERLYGWGEEIESNAVEVYIHALRRKLGADFIKTVRGAGYMVPKQP
jgi:two-component system, OmpR family, response regulator QseB